MRESASGNKIRARSRHPRLEHLFGEMRGAANLPTALREVRRLQPRFLPSALASRSYFVFAGFVFVVPLPNLLLDLFCHQVNGGVQVAFDILREAVRSWDFQTHGTGELPLRRLGVIMLEDDAGADRKPVQVGQFVNLAHDMVFDGLRERHVVRREDQVHVRMMELTGYKIQYNSQGCSCALESGLALSKI